MTKLSFTPVAIIFLLPLLACANGGGVLTIKHDQGALTFGEWEYREISTRSRWWVGCWAYDFLQGSGWFPSTWYQYVEPTENLDYEVTRTFRARVCNAQPDQYNSLAVRPVGADGEDWQFGFLRVVPDSSTEEETSTTTSATIRCAPAGVIPSPCTTCGLTCEEALLSWDGRGTAEITVIWEDNMEIDKDLP